MAAAVMRASFDDRLPQPAISTKPMGSSPSPVPTGPAMRTKRPTFDIDGPQRRWKPSETNANARIFFFVNKKEAKKTLLI
ncbi:MULTISPECIES: hypothetical protein [Acidiphilium]|uniref:hypothetical protein n=1 Tax=Acidiphilium TaxID=522 RepID=UPI0011155334|nr:MULTISPECIES: hypothetical protein [Acidiphilium]